MITVACCLWGDWPEKGWGEEYVYRLERAVRRNLTVPYHFVCIVDDPTRLDGSIETRYMPPLTWSGCLPKLNVYNPAYDFRDFVLLLDLDNVIVGDLEPFVTADTSYAVRAWFGGYPQSKVPDGDMIGFDPKGPEARALWKKFVADPELIEKNTKGRERHYIRNTVSPDLWQDILWPNAVMSYKTHIRKKGNEVPTDCSIISFHDGGEKKSHCRPHELDLDLLREHWY